MFIVEKTMWRRI